MKKRLSKLIALTVVSGVLPGAVVGEVLQSISDDAATPVVQASPPAARTSRRITYRVLCSPGDENLPDCEKPYDDAEGDEQTGALLPMPDLPPDAEEAIDTPEPETSHLEAQPATKKKPARPTSKIAVGKDKKTVAKTPRNKSTAGKNAKKTAKKATTKTNKSKK